MTLEIRVFFQILNNVFFNKWFTDYVSRDQKTRNVSLYIKKNVFDFKFAKIVSFLMYSNRKNLILPSQKTCVELEILVRKTEEMRKKFHPIFAST